MKGLNNMEQREAAYTEEASIFIKNNVVNASEGFKCVDGRYPLNGEQKGFLARPGGHFGIVMGLLTLRNDGELNMTAEECFDTVYNYVTKDDKNFDSHTDSHSVKDETITGCGHAGRAANPEYAEMFRVNPNDVKEAIRYSRNKEQHPLVNEVVLVGDHAEKGVIIVNANDKTVQNQDEDSQYFIYDKYRDDEFVIKFLEETNIEIINKKTGKAEKLATEKLIDILQQQTNATVALLASGRPVIEANLTGDTPITTFLQMVPPLAA